MTPDHIIQSGKVELAVYQWNSEQNRKPLLLFIHGYPDNAETWLPVIDHLTNDFRIAAYDVRGAGNSSKPWKTRDYKIPYLAQDLEAVLNYISPRGAVHLIAHDWGSIQSWHSVCAPHLRKRIKSYTSISGPCIDHVSLWGQENIKSGKPKRWHTVAKQLRHSWYMAAFQIPGLAPIIWGSGLGHRLIKRLDSSHVGSGKTLARDGITGARLYRANLIPRLSRPQPLKTDVPVQLIVPTKDPFATTELYDNLQQWAPNLWRKDIDAQHWLLHTHPLWLSEQIRAFAQFCRDTQTNESKLNGPMTPYAVGRPHAAS